MENLTQPYPWYDDRVEAVRKTDTAPEAETVHASDEPARYTPKEIYAYLDRKVWKQEDAKKAASVIMYNCLHGVRSTAMFIGPSGCGKTHIWSAVSQYLARLLGRIAGLYFNRLVSRLKPHLAALFHSLQGTYGSAMALKRS